MKKLIVLFVAIAVASLSQASELWWTVDGAAGGSTKVDGDATSWDTAKLYASADGFNYGGTAIEGGEISASDLNTYGGAFTDLGGYASSAYSFYVELLNNSSSEVVGRSYVSLTPAQGAIQYGALDGHLEGGNIMNPTAAASAYSFSSFTTAEVIPEPTSGLLVLLGMMALGLKRKRG